MKLRKISIKNFRCFQEIELPLADGVTVLTGKNGTGKTSFLHAVHNALSFIFAHNPEWGPSLTRSIPNLTIAPIRDADIRRKKTPKYTSANEATISAEATYNGNALSWELNKTSVIGSPHNPNGYKDAYMAFLQETRKTKSYPLLAYYPDVYPNVNTCMDKAAKKALDTFDSFPPKWGYYQWGEENSCTEIWQQRFIKCMNKIQTAKTGIKQLQKENKKADLQQELSDSLTEEVVRNEMETAFVEERMQKFTDNISSAGNNLSFKLSKLTVETVNQHPYLNFQFADKSSSFFEELSAGYRRILSIVFDIAYRAFILNGNKEPFGVVLIDDLDRNLHPELAQGVIQRLRNTFPDIQFIVSTHSPLVITNVQKNDRNTVIKLTCNNGEQSYQELPNLYGVDCNTALQSMMDANPASAEVAMLKELHTILLAKGDKKKAKEISNKIARLTGNAG